MPSSKGGSVVLGFDAMLRELDVSTRLRMFTDATAGKALASRRGLGRARHIEMADPWVQETVNTGKRDVNNLKNSFNTAGRLTKHVPKSRSPKVC